VGLEKVKENRAKQTGIHVRLQRPDPIVIASSRFFPIRRARGQMEKISEQEQSKRFQSLIAQFPRRIIEDNISSYSEQNHEVYDGIPQPYGYRFALWHH
jgi:hypothetical protein